MSAPVNLTVTNSDSDADKTPEKHRECSQVIFLHIKFYSTL